MPELNLESIELTTTLRRAPKNGSPSTHDYNASLSEILTDLSNIVTFLNEEIMPICNALPEAAADGLTRSSLYAAAGTDNDFFLNSDGIPLTVGRAPRVVDRGCVY